MQDKGVFVTYTVENFHSDFSEELGLELVTGEDGLTREFVSSEVHRPGLALAGFLKQFVSERLLVFGESELLYLRELSPDDALERLQPLLSGKNPAVIIACGGTAPPSIESLCKELDLPLFVSPLSTMEILNAASSLLGDAFAPKTTCHGTFIEAFGVGVMIQGDSSVGKSEAALGLLDRGHRLISDDVVLLRKRKDDSIVGSGPPLNKHMMELRGIGIINVSHLYGAVCVRDSKSLDLIVQLEEWKEETYYDRVGLDEKFTTLLDTQIPYHVLPVKTGRDVVLLIETIVLNHRLKVMGYHSAREFNVKLLQTISERTKQEASS